MISVTGIPVIQLVFLSSGQAAPYFNHAGMIGRIYVTEVQRAPDVLFPELGVGAPTVSQDWVADTVVL